MFVDSTRVARYICALIFEATDLFVIACGVFVLGLVGTQAWIVHKITRREK